MRRIERSALVMYSAEQMFALVNDIAAYPQFMEGVSATDIIHSDGEVIEARLHVSKAGIKQSFVTRNRLEVPTAMHMELVEGPFSQFAGAWHFKALNDEACKVSLVLAFEFDNKILDLAAGTWFESVANQQVDSLCERAKVVYR